MNKTIGKLACALVLTVVACATDGGGTTSTPSTPTTALAADSVIAELRTADGVTYRILLGGEAAAHVRTFEPGENPGIPNGTINPGDGGVNTGHQWHITEVEFVEMAIEVCDGTASYIDDLGYEEFVNQHGDRFCPWTVELVQLIER